MFFTATASVLLSPTISLPKLRLDVESAMDLVAVTPVPLNAMASAVFVAVLSSVSLPVTLLVVVGE